MKQTVSKALSLIPLDHRLNIDYSSGAPYQLELYHTKGHPTTMVGVLNNYTKKFAYKKNDIIDVTSKVVVTGCLSITNIVMNTFLTNYLKTR